MKKFSKYMFLAACLVLFGVVFVSDFSFAQTYRQVYQQTINGNPLQLKDFEIILGTIAGFLIIAGGILAGVAIIVSGIMYMSAGSDSTRLTTAKAWFKNGIIGALILFAVGLIIQTLLLLATDPYGFFS